MKSKKAVEKEKKHSKVMVFGTFDGLHPGHLNFFKQARALADKVFLIVSIARDKNVYRIKGKYPALKEKQRIFKIKKSGVADKVVLGGAKAHIPHILKERPDIIALGYDQKAYVPGLREKLRSIGLEVKIKRLKPYRSNLFKTHLLKN